MERIRILYMNAYVTFNIIIMMYILMYQQLPTVYQHDNYTEIKRTQTRTTHITYYAYIYVCSKVWFIDVEEFVVQCVAYIQVFVDYNLTH